MTSEDDNMMDASCPFCGFALCNDDKLQSDLVCMEEYEDKIFVECVCGQLVRVVLTIEKYYDYSVEKPTEIEIKKWEENNNIIEDVPGQIFMWDDLHAKN